MDSIVSGDLAFLFATNPCSLVCSKRCFGDCFCFHLRDSPRRWLPWIMAHIPLKHAWLYHCALHLIQRLIIIIYCGILGLCMCILVPNFGVMYVYLCTKLWGMYVYLCTKTLGLCMCIFIPNFGVCMYIFVPKFWGYVCVPLYQNFGVMYAYLCTKLLALCMFIFVPNFWGYVCVSLYQNFTGANFLQIRIELWRSFVIFVDRLTTGPKPLPKRALHILRSRAR
jgi:hypothetical protein